MGIFSFRKTPDNRGVGTGNIALDQFLAQPWQSFYGPAYNVRRSLAATRPAGMKLRKVVPDVPLEGNGTLLQGQMALQSLLEASKGKG